MRFKDLLETINQKMSRQLMFKSIDESIYMLLGEISTKYGISSNDLLEMWEGKGGNNSTSNHVKRKPKTTPKTASHVSSQVVDEDQEPNTETDPEVLLKMKKTELQAICRQKGVRCTGTKVVLVGYILGKEIDGTIAKGAKANGAKGKGGKGKSKPTSQVVAKLTADKPDIAIRRNQYGRYEHPETSFVFDHKTKKVIGKQLDDGNVADITINDIDLCNKFKFEYDLPVDLDKGGTLDDVSVEELEEEIIESSSDEEEILESDDEEEIIDSSDEEEILESDDESICEEDLLDDDEEEFEG